MWSDPAKNCWALSPEQRRVGQGGDRLSRPAPLRRGSFCRKSAQHSERRRQSLASVTACSRSPALGAHHAWPLLMAAAGTKGAPERDCEAMTLQQRPLGPRRASASALYVHSMPAWVLEDFCRKMDCLSDYDWMRFGEGPVLPGSAGGDGAHGGSAASTGGRGA